MASKNIWRSQGVGNRVDKGQRGEEFVRIWLEKKGLRTVLVRPKFLGIELDLLGLDQQGLLHIIEVKTLYFPKTLHSVIGYLQIKRIRRVLQYLIEAQAQEPRSRPQSGKQSFYNFGLQSNLSGQKISVRAHLVIFYPLENRIQFEKDFFIREGVY